MLVDLRLHINPMELRRQRLLLCYLARHDKSGVVEGLQDMCDAIADRIADYHGDLTPLLSGDAAEHEEGRQLVHDIMESEVTA
jgi:hypothetical protein